MLMGGKESNKQTNINPSLVLVLPRKTCPFITERLLMGGKESNKQTNMIQTQFQAENLRQNQQKVIHIMQLNLRPVLSNLHYKL